MSKTVLVTGSSKGVGKALILEFAKNGYNVVINYLTNKEKAEALKNTVENMYNISALVVQSDITNDNEVRKMIDTIIKTYGRIDVLINNAVYENDDTYLNKTKEDFLKTFEVNVYGAFNVIKQASKYLDGSTAINISSRDSVDTYSELTIDYSASKAALNSITSSYALALPNTKFISVLLPWMNTESVKEMYPEYLESELKRTNQEMLMEPEAASKQIYDFIDNDDIKSGSIIKL